MVHVLADIVKVVVLACGHRIQAAEIKTQHMVAPPARMHCKIRGVSVRKACQKKCVERGKHLLAVDGALETGEGGT
jgi:hypothetical protein